jgi:hypothetical protein
MKVKLKSKIIVLAVLPFCLPFMIPGLLKRIFYDISLITEAIGALFERIDFYFADKSKKFFKWVIKL